MTAYVMMRPGAHENAEIPNMFMWESLDGTQIPTFHIPDASGYGSGNAEAINRSRDLAEKLINEEGHGMMIFYGVGNHGGGPTRGLIEYVQTQLKETDIMIWCFLRPMLSLRRIVLKKSSCRFGKTTFSIMRAAVIPQRAL